jgi:hypothetical protein
MEAMRESWTDDKMDALNAKVDRVDNDLRALRVETKTEFTAVRGEMDRRFNKVDERFDRVDARFDKLDDRFEKIDDRFEKIDERFVKMDERFVKMDQHLHQIYQTMLGFCVAVVVCPDRLHRHADLRLGRRDLACLLLPPLAAAQHALGEDRDAEDRRRAEAELKLSRPSRVQ